LFHDRRLRRDIRHVPIEQRYSTVDAMAMFAAQRRLRRKEYNIDKILDHSLFAIEDLAFNSVLIRANEQLLHIATTLRADLPEDLLESMARTPKTLEQLWDPYTESYYSRDFVNHKLLKEPSIAGLIPLYAGTISKEHAALLVKSIENEHMFGPAYPIPSVPLSSPMFHATRYWQGPTWFSTNWLIIDGLKRYGYKHHAAALIESSLELVQKQGFFEYFDPLSGEGLGAPNFSWTASLTLDWLQK
jgi:glycogen debranching enzyme